MKLLITREKNQSLSLQKKLERFGVDLFFLPMIQIVSPRDEGKALKKALDDLSKYQWLILTSVNAVRAVGEYVEKLPSKLKIVVIGPQTFEETKKRGWKSILPNVSGNTESLALFFEKQKIRAHKILYPCSSLSQNSWMLSLERLGCHVEAVEAYQTRDSDVSVSEVTAILKKKMDAILFFSPSGVRSFFRKISISDSLLVGISYIPYGETTAEALRKEGLPCAFIPGASNPSSFEDQIVEFLMKSV